MTRWVKTALLLVACLGLADTACSGGDDQAGGDREATTTTTVPASAITPDEVGDLAEVWRIDGQRGVTGKPTVRDGVVYFGNWAGSATAVDLETGEVVWQTLVAVDDTVMLDAAALVTDEHVYLPDADGKLYALDRETGEKAWTATLDTHPDARIWSTPVLAPGGIIVIGVGSSELRRDLDDFTFRGSIVGIDEETGEELWRRPVSEGADGAGVSVWSSASIDVERGLAYIGTGQAYEPPAGPLSDSLLALHYDTGELEWHRQFTAGDVWTYFSPPPKGPDADVGATPTLFTLGDRDVVGVGDKAGTFDVFDRDTGETVWAKELTPGSPLGGVMVSAAYAEPSAGGDGPGGENGAIFVASNDMNPAELATSNSTNHHTSLFALDAATGDTIWEKRLVGATFGSITHADGVVYRPSVPGVLQALDAENGRELWSSEPGGDMGAGVRVEDGWVVVPHGFWFFGGQSDLPGGVVAYRLPD
jgi:polyvinyl alcohol dehydrogenase (cytochrome)